MKRSGSGGFSIHPSAVPLERWDDPTRGRVTWRTLVSADRTASDSLTVGVAEIEPAVAPRLHRHPQAEVYHILSGRGVTVIDGEEYAVEPGSVVFVPGDAWHGVRTTGSEPLRLFYAFATDSFADVVYDFGDPPPP